MRRALLWSAVWVGICIAIMVAVLLFVASRRIGGPMTPERSSQFGSATGIIAAIGLAPIWWIHYIGPLREARLSASKDAKKKKSGRSKRKT